MDDKKHDDNIYEYYELGFENIVCISAEHKRNISELLDMITEDFNDYSTEEDEEILKFAVIGRPNVGKSSLVNAILGEERQIVSDVAGTTRDSADSHMIIKITWLSIQLECEKKEKFMKALKNIRLFVV